MEQVAEQFVDAAVGTVADQQQGQDEPPQPGRGDRQVEQDGVVVRGVGGEGLGEGLLGLVGLLVDELAADVVVAASGVMGWPARASRASCRRWWGRRRVRRRPESQGEG